MFNRVRGLNSDRKGNESMQTIMIMAVGALLLMGLNTFFNSGDVSGQIHKAVKAILSAKPTIGGASSPTP
jgi:hypothetical protein